MLQRPGGDGVECPVVELPERFDETIQSWDMTFKKNAGTDMVAGQVWSRLMADKFLRDQVCARMGFVETLRAVLELQTRWPNCRATYIEDKANGPAIIDTLRSKIAALIPVNPEGGKEVRAHAVSPQVKAGNVYLPHPNVAPWVLGLIAQCRGFPKGAHDDQVDAMTQALTQMIYIPTAQDSGFVPRGGDSYGDYDPLGDLTSVDGY